MHDPLLVATAGFALGFLHSLEPDHLAAIATLVGRTQQRAAAEFWKGVAWAAGHGAALGVAGMLVLWLASAQPAAGSRWFELAVGVALVYLGFIRLRDAKRGPHRHDHAHGAVEHSHVHVHGVKASQHAPAAHAHHSHAPIWLGILHGFAGSGGLLAVMPTLASQSTALHVVYLAAFGAGSALSMGGFCVLVARSAHRMQARAGRGGTWFAAATGSLSLGVGIFWLATAASP